MDKKCLEGKTLEELYNINKKNFMGAFASIGSFKLWDFLSSGLQNEMIVLQLLVGAGLFGGTINKMIKTISFMDNYDKYYKCSL